jgi:hypothetical protein
MTLPISMGERDAHPEWPGQLQDDRDKPRKNSKRASSADSSLSPDSGAGDEREEPNSSSEDGDNIGTHVDFEA